MLKRGFQFAPGYRLQEFLGRGQFGQVWRATAPGGTSTAAKFIDLSDGQGQKEYDGIRRVKQIHHANLMPITAIWLLDAQGKVIEEAPDEAVETIDLSVAEPQGQSAVYRPEVEPSWLVVAMLLGGKSLQQRLRECVEEGLPGIPPKELISYMDESAKGIDFLNTPQHDLGEGPIAIQHSDVKPANIVLIGNSAVVCDFGLARILTRNQVTATSAAGTPAYMAPEAISGKPCRTSDQYSLAVTYYHLRTGTLPVNDGSLWEVLDAHRHGNLKLGLVPEAEQEVLRKATDLDWEKRFDSNVDMVDALREALRSGGHTKPSFVPKSGDFAPSGGGGATKAIDGDPTATIDLPSTDEATKTEKPKGSMVETAPFVQADESTKGGFAKESLPALDETSLLPESPATSTPGANESFVQRAKQNPKLVAGMLGPLLIAILAIVLWPSNDPPPIIDPNIDPNITKDDPGLAGSQGGASGAEGTTIPPVVDGDPLQLLATAIDQFDSDESAAVETFERVLKIDPDFQVEPLSRGGHDSPVMWMLPIPHGDQLVSIGAKPLLWNMKRPDSEPTLLPGHSLITAFAVRPNGSHLVTGGLDAAVRFWNLESDQVAETSLAFEVHLASIEAAAWHPSKPIVVTAADDGTLVVWTLQQPDDAHPNGNATHREVPINLLMRALTTDAEGRWLVGQTIGSDSQNPAPRLVAFSWDALLNSEGSPKPIEIPSSDRAKARAIATFDTGEKSFLITGEEAGSLAMYEATEDEIRFLKRNSTAHALDVEALKVKPVRDRAVIVSGAGDGSVQRWLYGEATSDITNRTLASYAAVSCVDVSTDGRWIAAGLNDGSIWLWDTTASSNDEGMHEVPSGATSVDSIAIDDGADRLIAGCDDGTVRMWSLTTLKLLTLTRPESPIKEGELQKLDQQSFSMK